MDRTRLPRSCFAACALVVLCAPVLASASPASPSDLALAALKAHESRLLRCLQGRPVDTRVKLRVNAHGWTDVVSVGSATGRVATCVRLIVEELHFSKTARAAMKGDVVLPVHVTPSLASPLPAPSAPTARAETLAPSGGR